MNIFYLHENPQTCAQYHVDKHCVKMIVESAQLLSTAHRVLDGNEIVGHTRTGRRAKRWVLPDSRETVLYHATHVNHPSAVWCRKTDKNYLWLAELLEQLCVEYTYRYEKIHKIEQTGLMQALKNKFPTNIPIGDFSPPTPAMPDEYKVAGNILQSYHNYYNGEKQRMFNWKKRNIPSFINNHILTTKDNYASV